MRFQLATYRCDPNGHLFRAPTILGGHGVFLARSSGEGDLAYVDAVSDDAFGDLRSILRGIPTFMQLHELERGKVVQDLFSITCDYDSQGAPYVLNRDPCCIHCSDCNVRFIEATDPPEFVDIDVPEVSHGRWDSMSVTDRRTAIEQALNEYFIDRADW
ncbi:hypothetical protein Rhe02_51720 [Rhizocola hellebori]|uniref:Uncharacterized protein n=1 Tax=Rhizocola hellebori TaxID=1392758 RepID=A0A8J3VI13_9ACTN|nr:hypothetical protein [Rhizocola hellebori]GIH07105.1 hypothetical protein Rhe02_51720 [Rhizocola hellebori]